MNQQEIKVLLKKYLEGNCSDADRLKIESWYANLGEPLPSQLSELELQEDLDTIYSRLPGKPVHRLYKIGKKLAVAAISIGVLWGAYVYFINSGQQTNSTVALANNKANDSTGVINPGENKAILTLADGATIVLDDSKKGEIAKENGISISKSADGMLIYTIAKGGESAGNTRSFNTISTPNGGQYRVVLPDGSQVWLNAASSLTYPTQFEKDLRKVKLSGEAYFEIAPEKTHPFVVETSRQEIEVLGTSFNVNNYSDEPSAKTTLLTGAVKVKSRDHNAERILAPGQQSSINHRGIQVSRVDTENAIAWKNGLFYFNGSDIQTVMRQYARWYNVSVEYEGVIPEIKLWGKVFRNESASKALDLLGYFNLKYRVEGKEGSRKIIIHQ